MEGSILQEIKKLLGISPDEECYSLDIIIHINSAFSTLTQLGVGPKEGFEIKGDNEVWGDFVTDITQLNFIKNYIYLKTRMLFDPPSTSFVLEAMKNQISEYEWRLLSRVEVELDESGNLPDASRYKRHEVGCS